MVGIQVVEPLKDDKPTRNMLFDWSKMTTTRIGDKNENTNEK